MTSFHGGFKRAAVLGSGVMGAQIAAHFVNAGIPCLLLDMAATSLEPDEIKKGLTLSHKEVRNRIVFQGLERVKSLKPNPFFRASGHELIQIGNFEDDLPSLANADIVVEAVLERLDVKQMMFKRILPHLASHAVVASNTSGLSLKEMLCDMPLAFRQRFMVTHFFNPVRYMHLLEIVRGEDTDEGAFKRVKWFGEHVLGKGVVEARDTPNFIANRIGVYGVMKAFHLVAEGNCSVEEVDAVFGPALGRPKSAVFRTADVVGLDTLMKVANTCYARLLSEPTRAIFDPPPFYTKMVEQGFLGQKSGKGFYKKEGNDILTLDLNTLSYRPKTKVRFESLGIARSLGTVEEKTRAICGSSDKGGELAFALLMDSCCYAASICTDIADSLSDIDRAMRFGFGWELGPFEAWDALGVAQSVERAKSLKMNVPEWVLAMLKFGRKSFYETLSDGTKTCWNPRSQQAFEITTEQKAIALSSTKRAPQLDSNSNFGLRLHDLGDRILCAEFCTKMNAIDPDIIGGIMRAVDLCEDGEFDALVLYNEGANFSVGANILLLAMAAGQGEWKQIEEMVQGFQNCSRRLTYSAIPTVAAPFNMTFGGGAELSMWCNATVSHAELYMGLVEVGVGLIPGGGGTVKMLARTLEGAIDDPNFVTEPLIRRAFETICMAKVSTSAFQAKDHQLLRASDAIVLNRSHLLWSAKQKALSMAQVGFRPPEPVMFRLPGKSAAATFEMVVSSMRQGKYISDHDEKIALRLANVLCGGDASSRVPLKEERLFELEREAFLSLCGEPKTLERITHMLQNNKPLRN
jgi:3-hydroxyacyl-CoA dehydrogenase